MSDKQTWLSRFWWTRGALAVMALSGLSVQLLNIEHNDFIDILFSIITSWNVWTSVLVQMLLVKANISVSSVVINTSIIMVTTVWPLCYFVGKEIVGRKSAPKKIILSFVLITLVSLSVFSLKSAIGIQKSVQEHMYYDLGELVGFSFYTTDERINQQVDECIESSEASMACFGTFAVTKNLSKKDKELASEMQVSVWNSEMAGIFERSGYSASGDILYLIVIGSLTSIVTCFLSIQYLRGIVHIIVAVFTIVLLNYLLVFGAGLTNFFENYIRKGERVFSETEQKSVLQENGMLEEPYRKDREYYILTEHREVKYQENQCIKNVYDSCAVLGIFYYNGEVVVPDLEYGTVLLRKACAGGSSFGCFNLGQTYPRTSDGGISEEAKRIFVQACSLGAVNHMYFGVEGFEEFCEASLTTQ